MRSAKQAGHFAHGEDRLIKPSFGPGTKPIEAAVVDEKANGKDTDGGDGGGHNLDPLLMALLKKIPSADDGWPAAKWVRWFRTFAMNVLEVYDYEGEPVELNIEAEGGGALS